MPARKGNERPDHQPHHQNQRQSAAYTVRELHQCFNSRGNRDDLTVSQRPVAPPARPPSRPPPRAPPLKSPPQCEYGKSAQESAASSASSRAISTRNSEAISPRRSRPCRLAMVVSSLS